MAQPLVPRSANSPSFPRVPTSSPGQIGYVNAEAVGFEKLPRAVADALAGVMLGSPVAANADDRKAKRRADGTLYEHVTAWWAGTDRYVVIDARRLLAPAGGQTLRPVSGWRIEGTIDYYVAGVVPTTSQWRFQQSSTAPGTKRTAVEVDDPLDVLPAELTGPVRGGQTDAWRQYGRGWAEETIVATLRAPARVKVLKAQRRATSRRALQIADWHAITLDSPIALAQTFATDSYGTVVLGPQTWPSQLPRA